MQKSSSAGSLGSLSLGKDLGKPRSLVVPRGHERSWSNPALAGAFSLRKYAAGTKHIPGERPAMARQGDPLLSVEIPLTQIDLNGGNGKWRQIKAEEEFARKAEERKEQRRQEIIKEKEKQRRIEELADRRKKHQEEEERRWQEEREQKHRAKLEEERIKREHEEKLRLEREAAEAERLRRMPRPCEVCEGTGKCQDCNGKGYSFSIFLVPSVSDEHSSLGGTNMDHGRVYQGCGNCGGYAHNMLGELKKGSGQCPACNGTGKIWPVIDAAGAGETSPKAKTTNIQSLAGSMEMFRQL